MTTLARMRLSLMVLLAAALCGPGGAEARKKAPGGKAKVSIRIAQGLGNDGATMVYVPGGKFLRGSTSGEPDVKPQRVIDMSAFYIDRFAVSQGQYRRCVEAGKCSAPEAEKGCNWTQQERETHPVNCVSWFQADEYCKWAGKRLPTEAQWEKAAVGPKPRTFPWGKKLPNCKLANYYHDVKKKKYCHGVTVPVDRYEAGQSPYGAVQMSGNVYQWVKDWYDKGYYRVSEARDPMGPHGGKYRVVRGGSWFSPVADLRATMRGPLPPVMKLNYLGFRCAMYADEVKKPPPAATRKAAAATAPSPGPHLCYAWGCPLGRVIGQRVCW